VAKDDISDSLFYLGGFCFGFKSLTLVVLL